ncbi:F-box/WD repeat-containing protein 7-like isoform X4 [Homalodisca vitripennis]|uniref:F-box/WD repeat-containing protein 7-like isoform X4 n=1 Tax=Homalodisca vitripennis TaxID=197043 RepID=UPI001EE9B24D|nr:F-box/WD repeat-containing protein 7-like isoform X4 [Homalodisca vitripennis]
METLPAEVVEMIALFLSIKDLKACCGTTHTWRDIFGQDTIWKRHCNRALAKCLGAAQSRVEPKFVLSEEEHLKNLSPLGEWRQAYLQEQLLWSHWRNGNYVMEELTIKSSYKCRPTIWNGKTSCGSCGNYSAIFDNKRTCSMLCDQSCLARHVWSRQYMETAL